MVYHDVPSLNGYLGEYIIFRLTHIPIYTYIYICENHWTQMKMLDPMAAQVLWNSPDICLIRGSPRRASQFLCRLRCHQTWPRDPRTKHAFSYKVNAEIIYRRMFHVLVQVWLPRASSQRFALRAFGNPGRISSKFLPKIIAPVEYGLFGSRHPSIHRFNYISYIILC